MHYFCHAVVSERERVILGLDLSHTPAVCFVAWAFRFFVSLKRAVIRRGSNLFLSIDGDDCEYDPSFRLYLQSRLSNPHYRPEVFATCTLINFIVTERRVSLRTNGA